MSTSQPAGPDPGTAARGPRLVWRLCQLGVFAALAVSAYLVLARAEYRIDVDVYQRGGAAWLGDVPLYGDTLFVTLIGTDLPFTYPPLAAVVFSALAGLSYSAASAAITVVTMAAMVVTVGVVLTGLQVWPRSGIGDPAWSRRAWLAAALVVAAMWSLEPVRSNLEFGQINAVLMALVVCDCVPRRTPWPRGLLVGLAMALKLTPAVFLLYFLLRRDGRAALTAVVSAAGATVLGALLAWSDSWQYWTSTVVNADRIGSAALNTNQNLAGALARLGLSEGTRSVLWLLGSLVVLAATCWAVNRLLRADRSLPALVCVALFGLLVSPVSWSHHWVWALPAVLVAAVEGVRRREALLLTLAAAGAALQVWTPLELLTQHAEADATWWRQLAGIGYVWWALATIAGWGVTAGRRGRNTAAPDTERAVLAPG